MSVIDSRKYGRPNMTNLSKEDFMRIKNTPPPDHKKLDAECARVEERMRRAWERENARKE